MCVCVSRAISYILNVNFKVGSYCFLIFFSFSSLPVFIFLSFTVLLGLYLWVSRTFSLQVYVDARIKMSISILVLRDRVSRLVLGLWVGFCGGCPVEGRDVERITSFPVMTL